ncbi:MFS transporter [Nocardia tenerifensis]|uniref:MFS transporter n=1 Tax=Nocardia tenerifensis TaxID=228006 RepID=A0A318JWR1_9NOCA|nr:MFS transporter [Nocardia tenerifensis]PXX61720.1 MFS transporter [Nocardia tenerifensis]
MIVEMDPPARTTRTANTGAEPMHLGPRRRRMVLLTLCAAAALISGDTALQTIAVQSLLRQLGHRPDMAISLWLPAAHAVAYVAFLLVGGALADRLGAKRVIVGGFVLYLAGAVIHLVCPDTPLALLVARTTMGAGAAAILPATLALVVLVYGEGSGRARAVTAWAGCSAAGVMSTLLLTAVVLNQVWWPYVMAGLAMADVVVLIGVLAIVPGIPADPASPVDWPAVATTTLSAGSLALALYQAPKWGWTSSGFAIALGVGVALAVVAAVIRRGGSLPHDWLVSAEPRVRLVMLALGTSIVAMFGMVYLVIQYLQVLGGRVPVVAGLALFLPACVATAIGAKVGAALHRAGCVVAAVIIGSTAIMDGLAIGLTAGEPGDLAPLVAMVTVTGLGCALVLGIALEVVSAAHAASRTGIPWGAQLILVQLSGLLGAAIVGGLVDHGYRNRFIVPADVLAVGGAGIGRDPVGDGVRAVTLAGDQHGVPLAVAVRNAFVGGYGDGLLATIAVVAVVVVVMLVASVLSRKSNTAR